MTSRQAATAIYVYCITEGEAIRADAGLHPLRAVHSVVYQELVAVASQVLLTELGPEALSSHLADAAWLEREARGHEAVIEEVMQTRTVLPLKFFTIFRTKAKVTALLRSQQDRFRQALTALRGKEEWEVKLFAQPGVANAGGPEHEPQGSLSGKEYLLRKAAARLTASAALGRAYADGQRCFEEVAGCVEHLRLMPIDAGSSLGQTGLIADAVCLLARACVPAFCQRLEALGNELRAKGLLLQASGPWPAYHFTGVEHDNVGSPAPA
ncbi:MAG TPA: GvpL/GvpF family gas vesicle protein [Armatimonadota bacterium]|nr:GvpL/GvpF family gas vesicle protein [Armatimonadota bacterium]